MNKSKVILTLIILTMIIIPNIINAQTTGAEEKILYYMEKHQENWLDHVENLGDKRTKDILQESEEKLRDLIYDIDSKEFRDKMIDELQLLEKDMEKKLTKEAELAKIKEKEANLEWEEKRETLHKNFNINIVIAIFSFFLLLTVFFFVEQKKYMLALIFVMLLIGIILVRIFGAF